MSISREVDLQNAEYVMYDQRFQMVSGFRIANDGKSKSKRMQIYTQNVITKFRY